MHVKQYSLMAKFCNIHKPVTRIMNYAKTLEYVEKCSYQ